MWTRKTKGTLIFLLITATLLLLRTNYSGVLMAGPSLQQRLSSDSLPHQEQVPTSIEQSMYRVMKSEHQDQTLSGDQNYVSNPEQSLSNVEDVVAEAKQFPNLKPTSDISSTSDQSSPDVELVMQARQAHIHSVCAAKNFPNFALSHGYYFPSYHFSWFPVFKAGSTTWKKFFIDTILSRPKNDYSLDRLSRYLMRHNSISKGGTRRRNYRSEPEGTMRFTIVRHPLSRLVSHFRKTVSSSGEMAALADFWVKGTIEHSRENPDWEKEVKERYQREMDLYLKGKMSPEDSPENPYLSPPSFPEFVSFILYARAHKDSRGDNVHWKPAAMWADICQMEIDIVAKLENEKDELPYLLEKLGLSSDLLGRFLTKENASGGKEVAGSEVRELISELSENDQKELNEIYQLDYEIFEYEPVYSSVT